MEVARGRRWGFIATFDDVRSFPRLIDALAAMCSDGEVIVPRAGRRAFAAVVLMLLAGGWAARGYCPMTVAVDAARGKASPHDCCKSGLTGKAPRCCHADSDANTQATIKAGPQPVRGVVTCAWMLAPSPEACGFAPKPSAFTSVHSPPPSVLRS